METNIDLNTVLLLVVIALQAGTTILKKVAPLTTTKVDDRLLEIFEWATSQVRAKTESAPEKQPEKGTTP